MTAIRFAFALFTFAACGSPSPTEVPPVSSPEPTSAITPTPAEPTSSVDAPTAEATTSGESTTYPVCTGQGLATDPSGSGRTGVMDTQLAPAFLDKMTACSPADITPPEVLAVVGPGKVNSKGDCAWDNGVSCHYHLGVEFVTSGTDRPARGEIHCIFPNPADAKSPEVFGGHFVCKGAPPVVKAAAADEEHAPHVVHEGASCGEGLLPAVAGALASCAGVACCDDGTLTSPQDVRKSGGTLDIRPDFHICGAAMELNCDFLGTMSGHSANAPAFGAPIDDGYALTLAVGPSTQTEVAPKDRHPAGH